MERPIQSTARLVSCKPQPSPGKRTKGRVGADIFQSDNELLGSGNGHGGLP
jgi:hypothetical protein